MQNIKLVIRIPGFHSEGIDIREFSYGHYMFKVLLSFLVKNSFKYEKIIENIAQKFAENSIIRIEEVINFLSREESDRILKDLKSKNRYNLFLDKEVKVKIITCRTGSLIEKFLIEFNKNFTPTFAKGLALLAIALLCVWSLTHISTVKKLTHLLWICSTIIYYST